MNEEIIWTWVPGISVGPFRFDSDVSRLIAKYGLQLTERAHGNEEWNTYSFLGFDCNVYSLDNGFLECVACNQCILYEGTNLIGLSRSSVKKMFGEEDEVGSPLVLTTVDVPVEYYELGAQVWYRQSDWVVNAVFVGSIDMEDT